MNKFSDTLNAISTMKRNLSSDSDVDKLEKKQAENDNLRKKISIDFKNIKETLKTEFQIGLDA